MNIRILSGSAALLLLGSVSARAEEKPPLHERCLKAAEGEEKAALEAARRRLAGVHGPEKAARLEEKLEVYLLEKDSAAVSGQETLCRAYAFGLRALANAKGEDKPDIAGVLALQALSEAKSPAPALDGFYDGSARRGAPGVVLAQAPAGAVPGAAGLRPAREEPPPLPEALRKSIGGVRWTPARIETLIVRMPKFETHLHLDGALSPETIQSLARKQNYAPLAGKSVEEIERLTVVKEPKASLGEVLKPFDVFYPLLRSKEALEEISYDLAASAKKQNTLHMEVRFAPALQAAPGFSVDDAVDAVIAGLKRGEEKFGVKSGVILCLYRPLDQAQNEAMFQSAVKHMGRGVVGIDIAGDEAKFPLSKFKDFFVRAKDQGLSTTIHAGEVPGSKDLELALELGVDRIGHGVLLGEKPELLKKIIERQVPVEVNVTSNLRTNAVRSHEGHPIRQWYRAGVPIQISTDDPGLFGIDLPHEYRILNRELGFTPRELIAIQWRTIDGLFLPEAEKRELRERFESKMAGLLKDLQ